MKRNCPEELLAIKLYFFLSKDKKEEVPRSCDIMTCQNQSKT